jgi:hypothetical protein
MRKEHIVIIILAVLLVGVSVAWVISSQPKGKQWVYVDGFRYDDYSFEQNSQNNFNTTTRDFVITGSEWQISWQCQGIVAGSHFDIFVYDAYTDNVVKEIVTPFQTLNGISYLNNTGRFYLKIFIDGELDKWTVYISQYQ